MAYDLTAVLKLTDQLSAPLKKIMNSLGDAEKATDSYRDANGRLRDANGKFIKSNGVAVGSIGGMVTALGALAGAVGATAIAMDSVTKAMDYEAQLSSIKALTGASADEMKRMSDLAMEMGASTKYSALEAAAGIEELLKAGITPAQVESGALEAALNIATAGGLDLAKASEIMSTALNAYKDDAMSAADASNILAGTANASATSVEELQYGLAAVGAVAAGIGQSFKDTNAALGIFANNGLKGSDAGTSLKTMLSNLTPMTDTAYEQMSALGLITEKGTSAFYDAAGNVKSLADIADILQMSMKDLNAEQRQQAMYTMFGSDAIRAANILFREGADGVEKFHKEMGKVTALDVAKEKMNNAAGAVEQFKGAMETMQIAVMMPLLPLIKDAATALADFVGSIDPATFEENGKRIAGVLRDVYDVTKAVTGFFVDNWPLIRETIIGVTAAIVVFNAISKGMLIYQTLNKLMVLWHSGLLLVTAQQWLLNSALLANPIGLVIAAIAALVGIGVVLYRNWDILKDKTRQLWDKLGAFKGVAVAVLGPIGQIIRAAVTMAENWDSTKSVWENVWNGIRRSAQNSINDVVDSINGLIETINKIPGVSIPIVPKVDWTTTPERDLSSASQAAATVNKTANAKTFQAPSPFRNAPIQFPSGKVNGYFHGIEKVPRDMPAYIHKDEAVLTRPEAKEWRAGKSGGSSVYLTFNYNGSAISEQELNRVGDFMLRKIDGALNGGA